MRVLEEYADILGQASIDEAYSDCTKTWQAMIVNSYNCITDVTIILIAKGMQIYIHRHANMLHWL